ncbi:hypothetical protein ADIS_2481 [Lunatimonas lonarensis]|uniref:Uncharacterized protein n=1 Tax=Lunatimonas lonarensis TaxID=1232681 RepID=R7ZSG9_9BACT|nr:hypothetical protein ADIS_2481 [Lunatimonas lonarensis]
MKTGGFFSVCFAGYQVECVEGRQTNGWTKFSEPKLIG